MPTGLFVEHPLTGEKLPVWVANYVLMRYGDGAVMAVPAHDERDFEFATKYSLPIKSVVRTSSGDTRPGARGRTPTANTAMLINSGEFDGLDFAGAFDAIEVAADQEGPRRLAHPVPPARLGHPPPALLGLPDPDHPLRHLRRRAGAGRPVAGGAAGRRGAGRRRFAIGTHARVLRVQLPEMRRSRPSVKPTPWTPSSSPRGTTPATPRRTIEGGLVEKSAADHWLPVDQYIGGIEHAILHLLYARFFHKLMRDEGLVSSDEPFKNLLTQGMVIAETYYRREANGAYTWFNPADVELERDSKAKVISAKLKCRRPAGGNRRHREDGQVEEQRRRPAVDDRSVRRRYLPPVHDVRLAA